MPVIATAAWSIPRTVAAVFPEEGSGLARYAAVFDGVEINSTFYRRHKASTFEGWAEATPEGFRFAVKIPKAITHERAMEDIRELFTTFLQDIAALGGKRGPLLCRLPPSLRFDPERFEAAFDTMRTLDQGPLVIEVRHRSWASDLPARPVGGQPALSAGWNSAPVWCMEPQSRKLRVFAGARRSPVT